MKRRSLAEVCRRRSGGACSSATAYRCQHCGRAGRLEVDHILRVADGGAELELDNLQALCRGVSHRKDCRRENTQEMRQEWRGYLANLMRGIVDS